MQRWIPFLCIATLGFISTVTLAAIAPTLWLRQGVFVLISLALLVTTARVPFQTWLAHRWWLYGLCLILLALPFLFGHTSRNTARWLELGFFSLQPSQLVVPFVGLSVVTLAVLPQSDWQRLAKIALLLIPPLALVFISPNLGTTILLVISLGSVLWFGNFALKTVGSVFIGLVLFASMTWLFLLKPYQQERVWLFLQGVHTESGLHYNALQAHIAIGNGGMLGQGWGEGSQASLSFLPERQTDFWFASYAEQSGFIGVILLFSVYSLLLYWLIVSATHTRGTAQLFLLITTISLVIQIFVNIGVNAGLLPITGVTLPFVSYGGSSFVSLCILLGIAMSAAKTSTQHNGTMAWYNLPSQLLQ